MKCLYVIHHLIDGGASHALLDLLASLKKQYEIEISLFTSKDDYTKELTFVTERVLGDSKDLSNYVLRSSFDIIHWFRTDSSDLFDSFSTELLNTGYNFDTIAPIILTHCQLPMEKKLALSVLELKYVTRFVFITKSAYTHKYHKCIPDSDKEMIYFGTADSIQHIKREGDKQNLLFIRGSTLNKCPLDTFKYFKKVNLPQSKYVIAGSGNERLVQKLKYEVEKIGLSNKVIFLGHLERKVWLEQLAKSDIYLYQLPKNAYSAIDGTIQQAMLSNLPVIYYGPSSPAELIEHGISGFIADKKSDIVKYAKLLAKDVKLRIQIGDNARKRILENFSHKNTVSSYYNLYETIISSEIDLSVKRRQNSKIFYTILLLNIDNFINRVCDSFKYRVINYFS